jgi:hypothetical protein
MKVNISLVLLGAVAASAIALPAQALPTINRTTTNPIGGGTILPAAYSIDNVDVTGHGTYDVTFKFGTYDNVFAGDPNSVAGDLAKPLGDRIIALLGPSDQVVSKFAGFVSGPQTTFFIPKALVVAPNNNDVFVECNAALDVCNNGGERAVSQRRSDSVLYATWKTSSSTTPTGNDIPTPALIPGLLGMGLAAMRKKQQAA